MTAAEINSVSEWLAGFVREEALPQKLFLLHQFRFSMITERETIQAPPELAVVIQMDCQGPLPSKYETYAVLTAGTEVRCGAGAGRTSTTRTLQPPLRRRRSPSRPSRSSSATNEGRLALGESALSCLVPSWAAIGLRWPNATMPPDPDSRGRLSLTPTP